jgi:hypothetical protein
MKNTIVRTSTLVALVLTTACATTPPPQPLRADLQDITVPEGLTYQPDRSAVIEAPNVKASRVLYRGRVEPESLTASLRQALEAQGWRPFTTVATPARGAVQTYQKGTSTLQVQIWEGGFFDWYTYLELTTSRLTQGAPTAAR